MTAWLCSCSSSKPPAESKQPVQQYKMHGEVVSLDPPGNMAKIKHEKIDGWMSAMTMEYPVKDSAEYKSLHAGDCINATVYVQDLSFWIGEIQKAPAGQGSCVAPAEKAP
jgi:protein SCO1/2